MFKKYADKYLKDKTSEYIPHYFPSLKYNDHYLEDIKEAIKNKEPYSWIRIGDGELVFLEQEYVRSTDELLRLYGWAGYTDYCGASVPNLVLRDRLIEAIKCSDLVGVFHGDPPMMEAFDKIKLSPENICYAFDNIYLPMNADFVNNILLKNKLLLVGQKSDFYAQKFKEILNIDVVGTVKIGTYADIENCMDEMAKYEYDVALVSAGINAKIICYEMSKKFNSVYLDMGHAWDNAFYPPGNYDEYWLIPIWVDRYYAPRELVIFENALYQNVSKETINTSPTDKSRWLLMEKL
jgi:hypothetical protein